MIKYFHTRIKGEQSEIYKVFLEQEIPGLTQKFLTILSLQQTYKNLKKDIDAKSYFKKGSGRIFPEKQQKKILQILKMPLPQILLTMNNTTIFKYKELKKAHDQAIANMLKNLEFYQYEWNTYSNIPYQLLFMVEKHKINISNYTRYPRLSRLDYPKYEKVNILPQNLVDQLQDIVSKNFKEGLQRRRDWLEQLYDEQQKEAQANYKNTSTETLAELALHNFSSVKISVAKHQNTSPETLEILAQDKSEDVRCAAALDLLAQNLLNNKSNDKFSVLLKIIENPNISNNLLKKLSKIDHPFLSFAAKERLYS